MPKRISPELKDLISKMLVTNPDRRIKIRDILEHPWISQINHRTFTPISEVWIIAMPCPDHRKFGMNFHESTSANRRLEESPSIALGNQLGRHQTPSVATDPTETESASPIPRTSRQCPAPTGPARQIWYRVSYQFR